VLVVGASVVVVVDDVLVVVVEVVVVVDDVLVVVVEVVAVSAEDSTGVAAASSATTSDVSFPAPAQAVAATVRLARSATTDARVDCRTKRT
jgi:hypothetical protein